MATRESLAAQPLLVGLLAEGRCRALLTCGFSFLAAPGECLNPGQMTSMTGNHCKLQKVYFEHRRVKKEQRKRAPREQFGGRVPTKGDTIKSTHNVCPICALNDFCTSKHVLSTCTESLLFLHSASQETSRNPRLTVGWGSGLSNKQCHVWSN